MQQGIRIQRPQMMMCALLHCARAFFPLAHTFVYLLPLVSLTQARLLKALDMEEYAIKGTEEEWEAALSGKDPTKGVQVKSNRLQDNSADMSDGANKGKRHRKSSSLTVDDDHVDKDKHKKKKKLKEKSGKSKF